MPPSPGWGLLALTALTWLGLDTLGSRLAFDVVGTPVVLNLQFAVGLVAAALLAYTLRVIAPVTRLKLLAPSLAIIGAVGLWLGSLEIDRAFDGQQMATQTGLSIYWALYGSVLVAIGFARRVSAARYAGLGLLAVTVLKFFLVDLWTLDPAHKFPAAMAVGLLLIVVSVLYSTVARLTAAEHKPYAGDDPQAAGTADR